MLDSAKTKKQLLDELKVLRKREEVLRESEERYRNLAEYAADAFYVFDREGRFVDVNEMACDNLGYTRQELLSLSVPDIQATVALDRLKEMYQMGLGTRITLDGSHRRKDGSVLPVECRIGAIKWGEQEVLFALTRDVTQRQRAEAALRELAVLEERHRLARELHDSVTQSLYSLTLFAEAGRRLAGSGELEQLTDYLVELGQTAQQALKEMRLLVYQLRPAALDTEGLIGALQQRLEAVEKRTGVEARLILDGIVELPPSLEEELYHVSQEALNNALKHAAATSVTVRFASDGESIDLEIEDNGRGFDPEMVNHSGGMGLVGMRERVERLGGSLAILSAPGNGTKVKVSARLPGSSLNCFEVPTEVHQIPELSR